MIASSVNSRRPALIPQAEHPPSVARHTGVRAKGVVSLFTATLIKCDIFTGFQIETGNGLK